MLSLMPWSCLAEQQKQKNPDVLLLPCGTTKAKVHELYVQACGDQRSMSYALFCWTWNAFLPGVHTQRPHTDWCTTHKQDMLVGTKGGTR